MDTYYPCDFDVHSKDYAKSHIRIFTQDEHQRTFIWAEIEWLKKKNRGKEYLVFHLNMNDAAG